MHPGEILRDEFLTPDEDQRLRTCLCDQSILHTANDIVLGRRAITIDTSICLGRYFGT